MMPDELKFIFKRHFICSAYTGREREGSPLRSTGVNIRIQCPQAIFEMFADIKLLHFQGVRSNDL